LSDDEFDIMVFFQDPFEGRDGRFWAAEKDDPHE
jgi:hypothetical protein